MEIIPAIIAKSFEELETKMSAVAGLVPSVQVDVLDGSLVPGIRAWPYLKATRTDADLTRTDAELTRTKNFRGYLGSFFIETTLPTNRFAE